MSEKEEKIRSFICIDFPNEVIKEISHIQETIRKNTKFSGKFTELENLHITLKFLGNLSQHQLQQVKQELSEISSPTLNLKLHSAGTFNFRGNPRIVWVKITGGVFELQKTIDEALSDLFKPEERFMSHLTIARVKQSPSPEQFIQYIKQIKPKQMNFQVNSFKLKTSELRSPGPVYSTLEEYKLK